MARYEAVLFDIDHTLAFDNKLELTVLHDMCEELEAGLEEMTKQDIMRHFDSGARVHFDRIRSGEMKIEAAMTEQFHYLVRMLRKKGLDPHHLALDYMSRVTERCREFLRVVPGASTLLADLKAGGYRTAIVTNGWSRLQREKARLVGFDGPVFISDDIGYWKPDSRAFETALDKLQMDRDKALYVGDSASADVRGARNAGLAAAWVNWEGDHFPEGFPAPDYEVRHLDELRPILLN